MARAASRRFGTTVLVVVALLFAQLALAGHACPAAGGHEDAVMEMAPGETCEGMAPDPSPLVLCQQHCANAPQTPDLAKVPAVSLPAVIHVLLVPLALDMAASAPRASVSLQSYPPPEPLFLSTLRLRV